MMRKVIPYLLVAMFVLPLFWSSCKKVEDSPPVAPWEDLGPDSVTLNMYVLTQQGIQVVGAYVYLYLSLDSLANSLFIRRVNTDGMGCAHFNRLYPRKFIGNCIANYQGMTLHGNFTIQLPPYAIRDTSLIVK
jgi:hypothetical protein